LEKIWRDSLAMNAFRGDDWMMEPCRSCARKEIDFGGCRCQAFMLAGNAAKADPICRLSPHHRIVESMRNDSGADDPPIYRDVKTSRRLSRSVLSQEEI